VVSLGLLLSLVLIIVGISLPTALLSEIG
jgi:hypothetical protein